ncbi:O-linked N-acetylglucosamine transferase, SPINDLY family protein [Chthoniobacter flavus]|nr:tetratricopeptide repeat protein [Chthoniobacter flavus]
MNVSGIAEALALGTQLHQSGRLVEAENLYTQVLAREPNHPEANRLLGIIAMQTGHLEAARQLLGKAIAGNDQHALAYSNLGEVYRALGQPREAIEAFRRALQIGPVYAEVLSNLGIALATVGETTEAISRFREALQIRPDFPEAQNNLGNALQQQGSLAEAEECYRAALRLRPDFPDASNNLGNVLLEMGRPEEAVACHRRALELRPSYPGAWNSLGNACGAIGGVDESVAAYREAIRLDPRYGQAYSNLAVKLSGQGLAEESLRCLRTAVDLRPNDPSLLSNLIYAQHFMRGVSAGEIAEDWALWNRRFGHPEGAFSSYPNLPEPDRRLRVGYVTSEFREHSLGRYLVPLFRSHDHGQFEIVCFSDVAKPDELTTFFREHSDAWTSIVGMSDAALAELVREKKIDILVDLHQHMGNNRLPLFARKPAPVQVSFAGYPASSGLEAIGYRLSDRWVEGMGEEMADGKWQNARGGAERVFLLDSFWCYQSGGVDLPCNALPALQRGYFTFGSLNNFCKVNVETLVLWARVLNHVPNARLVLLCEEGSQRQRTWDLFARHGISAERISFAEPRARTDYLKLYYDVDIVLDTFPYNGHTTSLDALWMGVPVVSLVGEVAVSRAGLSQLNNLGLPEWVAHTEDEYVEIATRLAGDLTHLAEMRATLRARMEASVLMDATHFTRQIEEAYRAMWRQWCEEKRVS